MARDDVAEQRDGSIAEAHTTPASPAPRPRVIRGRGRLESAQGRLQTGRDRRGRTAKGPRPPRQTSSPTAPSRLGASAAPVGRDRRRRGDGSSKRCPRRTRPGDLGGSCVGHRQPPNTPLWPNGIAAATAGSSRRQTAPAQSGRPRLSRVHTPAQGPPRNVSDGSGVGGPGLYAILSPHGRQFGLDAPPRARSQRNAVSRRCPPRDPRLPRRAVPRRGGVVPLNVDPDSDQR